MTGVERLEGMSMAFRGYTWGASLSEALGDIASQIKREHAEDCFRMGERAADVSMSAYDLLPEEEREAIAWVREHGGLGAVKKMADITLDVYQRLVDGSAGPEMLETDADTVDAMMAEIVEVVVKRGKEYTRALDLLNESVPRVTYERHIIKRQRQIDESHAALRRRNERIAELERERDDLRDMVRSLNAKTDEMEKQLMPEGIEWPRFEDGEPVRFGDEFIDHQGIERSVLNVKMWQEGGFEIGTGQGTYDWHKAGERVKRPAPKVLDADGVEIRVGDTVWHVETGDQCKVVEADSRSVSVDFRVGGDGIKHTGSILPVNLTHRAPVLADDGMPLRVGDTVWVTKDRPCAAPLAKGDEVTVKHVYPKTVVVEDEVGESWIVHNDHLTHERPDSWERLEEDATKPACLYFNHVGVPCADEPKCPAYGQEVKCYAKAAADLVRRARALAERGRWWTKTP